MMVHSKFFSTMATSLLFSVAMAILGFTWGCGDASQSAPDDEAKAKIQEVDAKIKEAHAKKRLP